MKILFDQGTPVPLRRAFPDHAVSTDRNLRYQQNLTGYQLAILVLPTTKWSEISVNQNLVIAAVDKLRPGDVVELSFA
jgi:hypothetical protein